MRITEDQIKTRDQTGNLAGQKGIKSKEIHSLPGKPRKRDKSRIFAAISWK